MDKIKRFFRKAKDKIAHVCRPILKTNKANIICMLIDFALIYICANVTLLILKGLSLFLGIDIVTSWSEEVAG